MATIEEEMADKKNQTARKRLYSKYNNWQSHQLYTDKTWQERSRVKKTAWGVSTTINGENPAYRTDEG